MEPSFERLIVLAKNSVWKLEFGYTILAVVDCEDGEYVVGQVDWIDESGEPKKGTLGPMKLIDVLDLRFSESLNVKVQEAESTNPQSYLFFVFGLHALYALLAEGLVHGTLTEKPNGIFEGVIELDEKKYPFSALETQRPMENRDFLLADGSSHPYKIL